MAVFHVKRKDRIFDMATTKKPKGLGRGLEALLGPKITDMESDRKPGPVELSLIHI